VIRSRLTPQVYANSSRARCAIYSRDTTIRICSVPRLNRRNPFIKITSRDKVMGLAEYFCQPLLVWISQIWRYPWQNPMWRPHAVAWQASPWEHRPSSLAPCVVPIRLSRIGQHIKYQPCDKQRALLGVFSSRSSSVSRGHRIVGSILPGSPFSMPRTCTAAVCHVCAGRCDTHSCVCTDVCIQHIRRGLS
jgi:hypothetical protein